MFPALSGIECSSCLTCCHRTAHFRLYILAPSFPGSLPDIQPGAFEQLQSMQITALSITTLPPSWGSHPTVLPALKELRLNMQFAGPLPAAWSGGFRQLQYLTIRQLDSNDSQTVISGAALPLPDFSSGNAGLPTEWTAGFPNLIFLQLHGLAITGSIPNSWITTGFPKLAAL